MEELDATAIVIAALRRSAPLNAELFYATVGSADDRAISDADSVRRLQEFALEPVETPWMREHAPTLIALSVLRAFDQVDWEGVLLDAVKLRSDSNYKAR